MAAPAPQPDPVFTDNVERLAETSGAIAEAARGRRVRPWQTPPGPPIDDHADPAALTPAFDRTALGASYAGLAASGGSVGRTGAVATQISWVAACERAYRARSASPIRCAAVASARRAGHAHPRGVLRGGTIDHVQALLAAGATTLD